MEVMWICSNFEINISFHSRPCYKLGYVYNVSGNASGKYGNEGEEGKSRRRMTPAGPADDRVAGRLSRIIPPLPPYWHSARPSHCR